MRAEGRENIVYRTRGQAGIGRCGDLEHAVVGPADAIDGEPRARHVTREPLQLPCIFGGERLSGKNREPGMDPGEKILHETLRQAFLLMQASEKKTAKQLANRRGIEGG